MNTAYGTSQYFIRKGIEQHDPVCVMRLQKIMYIFHGFYLSLNDKAFFNEMIEAWKFGPVIPGLYQKYSLYRNLPIDNDLISFSGKPEKQDFTEKDSQILENTWNILKSYTLEQLVNWTNDKNGPWFRHYYPVKKNTIIPNEDISDYFKNFLLQ